MKITLALLALTLPILAQNTTPPALLAKEPKAQKSSPLRVTTHDVQVSITGNTAETTSTLTFSNSTDRILEGELVFPLSQGTTISGYALQIGDNLRPGVIVEKSQGTMIFEDTIRQQIDPGLVEYTKGNNFRTRIYPIPANGTKKVQISYEETLTESQKGYHYTLPLAYREKIDNFSLNIRVNHPDTQSHIKVDNNAGLKLSTVNKETEIITATQENFLPTENLKIHIPRQNTPESLIHTTPDGKTYFYITDQKPHKKQSLPRPKHSHIKIIWDASNSGTLRNIDKEITLLENYLKHNQTTTVELEILNNTVTNAGALTIDPNNPENLTTALKAIRYDGATRLELANLTDTHATAILLFTDGITTLGQTQPTIGEKPVFTISSATAAEHSTLTSLARKSNGAYINLQKLTPTQALTELTTQAYSLLSITGKGIEQTYPSLITPIIGTTTVSGILTANEPTEVTLNYGTPSNITATTTFTLDPKKSTPTATVLPRLWAQKQLAELDLDAEQNRPQIITLAQAHGIVTRFTSLLVLDRLEDYVQHRITPPEPEMRKQYESLLKSQPNPEDPNKSHMAWLSEEWKKRVAWHKEIFKDPKLEVAKRVKKILKSLPKVEKKLTAEIAKNKTLSKEELKSANQALAAIQKIKTLNQKPKGQNTLQDNLAILKIVASLDFGDGEGEGIVSYSASPSAGSSDPFADAGEGRPAPVPNSAPRRREQANQPAPSPEIGDEYRMSGRPSKKSAASPKTASTKLAKWDPKTPYLKSLRQAKTENKNLEDHYFNLKPKYPKSSAFYLDVAQFFITEKQPKIALRILSNVAELDLQNPPLLRILAHRYDQLGQHELAELLFREILELRPEEPQSLRDLALILEKRGQHQQAADLLWKVAINKWHDRLQGIQIIALTELNRIIALNKIETKNFDSEFIHNLDADIRIVLTWDADNTDIDLWVTDPIYEKCYYSHPDTITGGHCSIDFTQGYGPETFMIKNAMLGDYKIQTNFYGNSQQTLAGETTIQATLITNWARPTEKRQAITLRLKEETDIVEVGTLTFKK